MSTKIRKLQDKINSVYEEKFHAAVKKKFGLEVETHWNIVTMRLMSYRKDKKKFTKEQAAFMEGWSDGYTSAMNQVVEMPK